MLFLELVIHGASLQRLAVFKTRYSFEIVSFYHFGIKKRISRGSNLTAGFFFFYINIYLFIEVYNTHNAG